MRRTWRPFAYLAVSISLLVSVAAIGGAAAGARTGSSELTIWNGTPTLGLNSFTSTPGAWCGNGETPDNRLPQSGSSGASTIRVLFAYPADSPDRFGSLAGAIVTDVAAIDGWWRGQDPARDPRWDLYAFPGCTGGLGGLDLGVLRLAHDRSYYASASGFERVLSEVAPHLGASEKALVFLDGFVIDQRVCGVSEQAARNGGEYGLSVVSLQSGCLTDLGAGARTARVAAHELTHNLGAVPRDAANRCGDSSLGGHVCDSANDLMFPYAADEMTLASAILDVGRDDYYGHAERWWDVQDSAWLVVVRPIIGRPTTAPVAAVAGTRFTVSFNVTRSDDNAPLETGTMICDPSVHGKVIRHAESFVDGVARLSFLVPKTAKGKALKVKLAIVLGDQTAYKSATFRVK